MAPGISSTALLPSEQLRLSPPGSPSVWCPAAIRSMTPMAWAKETTLNRITNQAHWLPVLILWMVMGGFALQAQTAPPDWIYSTYLGGSRSDFGNGIAVKNGWSYVVGLTSSPDFPRRRVPQTPPPEPVTVPIDGFLSIFGPAGDLFYSTYVADPLVDSLEAVAVGPGGQIYLAGNRLDLADFYAVVARLDLLTHITYFQLGLGGRSDARDIAADSQGNVYVTGAHFREIPVFGGFFPQVYVVKLGSDGSRIYNASLDGSGYERGNGLVPAQGGEVWV